MLSETGMVEENPASRSLQADLLSLPQYEVLSHRHRPFCVRQSLRTASRAHLASQAKFSPQRPRSSPQHH